jgi:hypothetical protein
VTETDAAARASNVVQILQEEFLADPQGLDPAQIRAFFAQSGPMLRTRIARGLLARAAARQDFPPAPPTVPVMITVENNGAGRAKSTPRHLNTYRLSNWEGVEALLREHGWIIDTVGPTHIYAAAPDNRRLGRDHVQLRGAAPTEEAFLAWAEQVHAFFTHHPDRLKKGRYEDPAGKWIYWGRETETVTTRMASVLGGHASAPITTTVTRDAYLSWSDSGGQLRVTWKLGAPPALERMRISYELPRTDAAGQAEASDPTLTTGGVKITRAGGMLYVESPKSEPFRRWARMTGGSWIRSFGDGAWRFGGDIEEALRRRLERDYGTDGAPVPAVPLRIRWTQAYVRDFVAGGNSWEEASLHRPIATRTRRGIRLDVGVRLISGHLAGLTTPQDAVLEVQGVPQPLAARLIHEHPDTFFPGGP